MQISLPAAVLGKNTKMSFVSFEPACFLLLAVGNDSHNQDMPVLDIA